MKNLKVLIVDDEPLVRRSLSRALQSRGHLVIEAEDGVIGLSKWKEQRPDLVFLDVLMPGLSGPQVLQELGASKTGKVILMSAYSGEHNVQSGPDSGLYLGADLFIPKPFDDIFKVVERAEELVNEQSS